MDNRYQPSGADNPPKNPPARGSAEQSLSDVREKISRHAELSEVRKQAINEAIVWLTMYCGDLEPECLAGEMARHFFAPVAIAS